MAATITTISKLEPNIQVYTYCYYVLTFNQPSKMEIILKSFPYLQALCEESLKAMLKSYSPYSKFKVGAAIQCGDNVISGNW